MEALRYIAQKNVASVHLNWLHNIKPTTNLWRLFSAKAQNQLEDLGVEIQELKLKKPSEKEKDYF